MNAEPAYVLDPTTFRSLAEAQKITNQLEDDLASQNLGGPNLRPEVVRPSPISSTTPPGTASATKVKKKAPEPTSASCPHRGGHAPSTSS